MIIRDRPSLLYYVVLIYGIHLDMLIISLLIQI